MTTTKELEKKLRALEALLATHGIASTEAVTQNVEDRADFIPHGSGAHAAFLGLVPAEPDNNEHMTYTSPRTGKTFMLEDEITQFMHYPDPKQVAGLVLQQKVNVLESKPEAPEDAPPLWKPRDF